MSRVTKPQIASLLADWASLRARQQRIEAAREKQIAEHRTAFEQACAPAHSEANRKLTPIQEQLNEIENQITTAMKASIDAAGKIGIPYVTVDNATAEVVSAAQREIKPEIFFEETPPEKRTAVFWECVKIQIGKAEKFLGSRIDELAALKRTYNVKISLK